MAELDKAVKKTPTLSQIANLIKSKAVALAPKKTGNLKSKLDTYNRPSGMVKQKVSGKKNISLSFTLDVSPPGAEYGKFWNDPNVSDSVRKGKTPNVPKSINFADKALEDPQVKQMIDKVISDMTNDIVGYFKTEAKKL
jgi:hypothetical protein